jgi:putative membrane protein
VTEEIQKLSAPEVQVELARTRTLLALDRTLLAWVRTSISLIAFGFTLAKFVHDLITNGALHGMDVNYPRHVGIVLMVLGITGLLGGAYDHWRSVKRLRTSVDMPVFSVALLVALFLAAIGLLLMISLISDLSHH